MMSPTLNSCFGPILAFEPQGISIPTGPAELIAFALQAGRDAEDELAAGHFDRADRLHHAALEARARAVGGRA